MLLTLILSLACLLPAPDADDRAPARPVKLTAKAAAAVVAQTEKARADADAWLRSAPTSYLATIARQDFGARTTLTVGRAEDNDVRLEGAAVSAHHLRVTVSGDLFQVRAVDSGARFTVKGRYVDAKKLPDGRYRLDFNAAYNPACATRARTTRPVSSFADGTC